MKKITLSFLLLFVVAFSFAQTITVELLTDRWASETAWGIYNSQGDLIAQNGALTNSTLHTTNISVTDSECYHFLITDSYGDGISDDGGPNPGYLNILYDNVNVGGFSTADSNFGSRLDIYGLGNSCPNIDAKLVGINNTPFSEMGNIDISCTVQNTGLDNLTSFDINYQIDGGAIVTQSISGVDMEIGDFDDYIFTTPWGVSASGEYDIHVWVTNANGNNPDGNVGNDSKNKTISIASQNTQRLPLYEEFTSSTCAPCASFNTNSFNDAFLNSNDGKYSLIKYQMNWPGSGDPYYTAEGGIRRGYYNVSGVPTLVFDGFANSPNFYQNPSQLQPELDIHYANPAFITMNSIFTIDSSANTVDIEVGIDPYVSGDYKVYAVVVEGTTTGNVSSNGETSFTNVMMKMVPDANGTLVSLVDGNHVDLNLSASLAGTNVEDMSDLKVVVFVQHDSSKIMMQSANSNNIAASISNNVLESVQIYPNPTNGILNIKTNSPLEISIFDILGKKIYANKNISDNSKIDLSTFEKGVYLINIFDGNKKSVQKIILK